MTTEGKVPSVGLEKITMKDMPEEGRPRERLLKHGSAALSVFELLAIILRTGSKKKTAIDVAYQLLNSLGGLRGLVAASVDELAQVDGVGAVKAAEIKAAIELGARAVTFEPQDQMHVGKASDIAAMLMADMRHLDREHFKTVLLNAKHRVLGVADVSVGCLTSSLVHPREVFKEAIRRSSAAVVLVHNHPSGDPSPSREDILVTERLVRAGEILGIQVLDHVILGDSAFVSLREKGLVFCCIQ